MASSLPVAFWLINVSVAVVADGRKRRIAVALTVERAECGGDAQQRGAGFDRVPEERLRLLSAVSVAGQVGGSRLEDHVRAGTRDARLLAHPGGLGVPFPTDNWRTDPSVWSYKKTSL